jgi:hypothetical protein
MFEYEMERKSWKFSSHPTLLILTQLTFVPDLIKLKRFSSKLIFIYFFRASRSEFLIA